ncbi:zinc finger protein 2-like [Dermacentor albipictus]|uniref:zinc finger protein 2-like n=1 Tax=Dermacentor albipictus TaxID=60249 RepID=UPI0031FDC2FC
MERHLTTGFRSRLGDDKLMHCRTCRRLEKQRQDVSRQGETGRDAAENVTSPEEIVCPLCRASLADSHALVVHDRLHKGIRPFECHRCSETFLTVAGLILHRHQHCRQPRYRCDRCHRHFQDVALYTRHCKKHGCIWKRARLQMLALNFWRKRA